MANRTAMQKIILLLLLCCIGVANAIDAPRLVFSIANKPIQSISLDTLKVQLKTHQIALNDPHYKRTKRFSAFAIEEVLTLAYGEQWHSDNEADITFTALDGYKAIGKISQLMQLGGYLAFADSDAKDWLPIGYRQVSPAPFYLVWTGEQQSTQYGFPWPWQLASIDWLRFEDQYPAVYPHSVATDSTEYQGFEVFKHRCFRCHSMNGQGGKIGPDLNAPKSIVEYRAKDMIKAFIRQPSAYRYTQMPDHLDLSKQDLDALIDYFWHQSKSKTIAK